ncbi:cytochrome c oxidase assembly protein [Streptomyces sp. NPDC003038]|uniref:cytochrome c oxidase assembly protein n=1 Tax=unclassified Streptomyces TaxID=2593676 RepID=UPI0033B01727
MTAAQLHPGPAGTGASWAAAVAATAALLFVAAYLLAAARLRRRGDAWPRLRDVSFAAGGAAVAWAAAGTLPGGPFTVHMGRHLLVGMAAPLLLVLARPLTLALRALPPGPVRRVLPAAAHSRTAGRLLFPPVAALLDIGGLWLLYRTPLWAAAQHRPLLHILLYGHVLAAGLLFTFAVCRLDPVRRRWGLPLRGGTLLAAGAAHAVLAKTLYSTPPPGTGPTTADLHAGALLMYYGGDLVELALAVALATQWYAASGRTAALTRSGRACGGHGRWGDARARPRGERPQRPVRRET